MISLEQVQLLEIKVAKAIEYIQHLTAENSNLVSEKQSLLMKLKTNQKRLDELELLIMRFKEDQGRIEDGIIAALDRLSQFEEAFENGLKDKPDSNTAGLKKPPVKKKAEPVEFFEINETVNNDNSLAAELTGTISEGDKMSGAILAPEEQAASDADSPDGELDIF